MATLQKTRINQFINGTAQGMAVDAVVFCQLALGGQTITGLVVAQHFLLQLAGNLEVKGFTGISGKGVQGHGSDLDM